MRLLAPVVGILLVFSLAGCGGSEPAGMPEGPSLPGWVEGALAEREGPDLAVTMASSDFAVGENRLSFLVIRNDASLVQAPAADVRVGRAEDAAPARARAELVPLGPHSHPGGAEAHDHPDATDLYVAHVAVDAPGRYWLVVDPDGEDLQGVGTIEVREETISPPVGSEAPASNTPTLADAPAREITTARPPDRELLRHSIADSLEAGVPFVVVFATPAFCQSRTCGPTVEVVDEVRRRLEPGGVRFIHVEIYEDNDPDRGFNRWVREWNLPTEPWVFLVDGAGEIRAKFEGSVSVPELEEAVREHLLPRP